MKEEKILIIIKPDAIMRGLVGEVFTRFERKGFKIIGTKMIELGDILLDEHYAHLKDKPFFQGIKDFMTASPVILVALSGVNASAAARLIAGQTAGHEADAGTIRGDFSMSIQSNIVHVSDTTENGEIEVSRFFDEEELFSYRRSDEVMIYSDIHEDFNK
jgi:nucleoside-diphosphate kinase